MEEHVLAETQHYHKPTAHVLIEVFVSLRNADPLELVLKRCCQQSGDTLLAKDHFQKGRSLRYTVLLADPQRERLSAHLQVLMAALLEGLLGFACRYVPLLVQVQLPAHLPSQEKMHFPLKEQGSERYSSYTCSQTFYVTRPQDYTLDVEQRLWLQSHQAEARIV